MTAPRKRDHIKSEFTEYDHAKISELWTEFRKKSLVKPQYFSCISFKLRQISTKVGVCYFNNWELDSHRIRESRSRVDSRLWHCLVISEIGDPLGRVNYLGI